MSASIAVAVFGVSTPFGYRVFELVRDIVEVVAGRVPRLHIFDLEQLRQGIFQREGASVVITTDMPSEKLSRVLCASRASIIAVGEDLQNVFTWAQKTRSLDTLKTLEFCTLMVSSLAPAFLANRALLVDGRRAELPATVVTHLVKHLFPESGETLATQVFEALAQSGRVSHEALIDRAPYATEAAGGQECPLGRAARLAFSSC